MTELGILNWGTKLLCQDKLKSQINTILKNSYNICVYENINFNFLILNKLYTYTQIINFNMYIYTPRHKIFLIKETYNLLKL